jgi:hypothetical protein
MSCLLAKNVFRDGASGANRISALSRRLRDKRRGYVLNLFASALGAKRMCGVMFSDMFDMLERFAALFATIFVGGHGGPPASILHTLVSMIRGEPNPILQ